MDACDEPYPVCEYSESDAVAIGTFMAVEYSLQALHAYYATAFGANGADAIVAPLRAHVLHQRPAPPRTRRRL